jgi:hypothetical protein
MKLLRDLSVFSGTASCALALLLHALLHSPYAYAEEALDVQTRHQDAQETAVQQRIQALVQRYHLQPWLYTRKIEVDKDVWPPHSHPVLTMGVSRGFIEDDMNLVTNLVHEEFHWHVVMHSRLEPEQITALLKPHFPALPAQPPLGSGDEKSTYNHVLVCYMEYKVLSGIFGADAALKSIQQRPYYKAVYAVVADPANKPAIEAVLEKAGLQI